MIQYSVILFHTTSSVMRAEKLLLNAGLSIRIIPTPREFSNDCGIAIRFPLDRDKQVKSLLDEDKVEFEAIYPLEQKGT